VIEKNQLKRGSLKLVEGTKNRNVSTLAVNIVASEDKKALIIDGSNTVDPYFMVKECKKTDLDERKILKKIMISRAFTAYQWIDVIEKADQKLNSEDFTFFGCADISSLFKDDEVNGYEGRWLRSRSIKRIRSIVQEKRLYGVIVDQEVDMFRRSK